MNSPLARLLCSATLLVSCTPLGTPRSENRQVGDATGAAQELPDPQSEPVRLPAGWATMSAPGFERLAEQLLPGDLPRAFTSAGHATLEAALSVQDQASVRAAILLARSQSPAAKETLLNRLEARDLGPHRASDAGDCTAAAGLASFALEPLELDRLTALVLGGQGTNEPPHPDVEVRVEIARVLLERNRPIVTPFMLRVLREGTRSSLEKAIDWERKENMAWAKSRTAEALCNFLGTDIRYDPDGAFTEMELEVERLEAALAEKRAPQESSPEDHPTEK